MRSNGSESEASGAPTDPAPKDGTVNVSDILLVRSWPLKLDADATDEEPVLTRAVEVVPGIWLGGIDHDVATPVMMATAFRSPWPTDVSVMYGLVRHSPPGRSWDEDEALARVLFLSHFVRATEAGFEYAARVTRSATGRIEKIEPADALPPFARAYCCVGARRRWLTQADAADLRDLASAYDALRPALPGTRLGLAVSTYAEAPFVYHGRPRGLLLTTILEGLVSTMPARAVKQFITRIPPLAAPVGMPRCDRAWAERTYELRSTLAHGSTVLPKPKPEGDDHALGGFNQTLTEVDELLRRLIRLALLDSAFRRRLDDLDKEWPVPARGCPACQAADTSLLDVLCPRCHGPWSPSTP